MESLTDLCRWLTKRLDNTVWTRAKSYMRADGGTGSVYVSPLLVLLVRTMKLI
jgi:hypothetical protein